MSTWWSGDPLQFVVSSCMQILLHPEWGSSIYPASIFAITSKERFSQALRQAGN
jgi:hypothetical protein